MNDLHISIISLMIEYERSQRVLTNTDFYKKKFIIDICSRNTYQFLITNKRRSKDSIYLALLNKLGYSYKEYKEVDNNLSKIIDDCYQCVISLNGNDLMKLHTNIDKIFKEAKHFIFYKEYYVLLNGIYQFYYYGKLHQEDIERIEIFYQVIFDKKLKQLATCILFEYYQHIDSFKAIKYTESMEIDDFLKSKYYLFLNYTSYVDYINFMRKYKIILEQHHEQRKVMEAFGLNHINYGKFKEAEKYNRVEIPIYVRMQIDYYVGYYYYRNNNYEQALPWFLSYLKITNNDFNYFVVACAVNYLLYVSKSRIAFDEVGMITVAFKQRMNKYHGKEKRAYEMLFYIYSLNTKISKEEIIETFDGWNHILLKDIVSKIGNIKENSLN